jgi:WD40 repeat protein
MHSSFDRLVVHQLPPSLEDDFIVCTVGHEMLCTHSVLASLRPRSPMKKILVLAAASILCSILVYPLAAQTEKCAPPVSLPPSTEPNIFSDEQEIYLGEAIAEHIQRSYHVIEDTEVTGYLTSIGNRLVSRLPLNKLKFQFFLVDLPDANAFVLPGGRIYVSRKLVSSAQNEDELASVISHELGHLVAHQSAIDTTRLFKEVLGVSQVTDRRDVFEKYNRLIENLRTKPSAFKVSDREKGQLTADQAGMFALVSAGYDVSAMARFWNRITEAKGKTGNWLSDLFGTTRPEEKRLREMTRVAEMVPAECRQRAADTQAEAFKEWQSLVITYSGLGRKESLHGVVAKRQLSPPLRGEINWLRFSPDGQYIIAQDDAGINVLSREPFLPIFRIDTPDYAYFANFTPDSKEIVFHTENLRVERWSIADQKQIDVKEVVLRKGCLETELSPDGKLLACLNPDSELSLINVASGAEVWSKKNFYAPDYSAYLYILRALANRPTESNDLNLELIHMHFSPDGRYFAAGYYGPLVFRRTAVGEVAEAIDTSSFAKVALADSLKKFIAGGFVFLGNDQIAGINHENVKKSGVARFPSGEVTVEVELWRQGMGTATRGDYLLIRPIKDYALGVMDVKAKSITKVNERAALDIFEPYFVAEMRSGQIGLYRLEKNEIVATVLLSNVTLGRLRVAEVSPDLQWLALSSRSRGGVWNLAKGDAALSLRSFHGGYVSDDGKFFGEFPKYEQADHNVAQFNLATGDVTPGPRIEDSNTHQYGQYLLTIKSAKPDSKTREGFESVEKQGAEANIDYRKNTIVEMSDARTMKPLWSRNYSNESPRIWIAPSYGSVATLWDVSDEAAKAAIKADPQLTEQQAALKEKQGDYFLELLDIENGNVLGKLLIETGKGSFRLANVVAAGEWVITLDTRNRVLVYSLKTGALVGRAFGGYTTVSLQSQLLCVENEAGKLAIYDLRTMEKLDELTFASPISMLRFSADGSRLFVLTKNQTAYFLSVSASAKR